MAKVAVLVPYLEMREIARPMLEGYDHIQAMCVEYATTDTIAERARTLEAQGCELIVSRGLQARIIRPLLKIPVVEMRITAQELGSGIVAFKRELGAGHPRLALIGFANMFCDTSCFDDLFDVELRRYMVEHSNQLVPYVEQAARDGCVGIVGATWSVRPPAAWVCPASSLPRGGEHPGGPGHGQPYMHRHRSGKAQLRRDGRHAELHLQRHHAGGPGRLGAADQPGGVRPAGQGPGELLGWPITQLLPNLSEKVLQDTLYQGKEAYAFLLDINHKAVIVNIAPVEVDGEIEGAVLTFQEGRRITEMDNELRRELYQRGFIAKYNFDNLVCESAESRQMIALARRIAKYAAPVMITGESGTGKSILAQCIHNESLMRKNAFVPLDCSAWMPETLDNMLFGNYSLRHDTGDSMAELAQNGTLYLSHVEALPLETQYKLLNLIRGRFLHNGSNRPTSTSVRVIASSDVNLISRVEKGSSAATSTTP